MQKFLVLVGIVVLGLCFSFFYGTLLFGVDTTIDSVEALGYKALSLVSPEEKFMAKPKLTGVVDVGEVLSLEQFYLDSRNNLLFQGLNAPLLVPTNGVAGHKNFLYLPATHPGIDIWSNKDGSGVGGKKYGNPVYSACSGVVSHYKPKNEEIEIRCDRLSDIYKDRVPSLDIKVLYSHLGDGETLEPFHKLKVGQRLKAGEFLGYQGSKSSFVPENKVVHLHLGVYDLSVGKSPAPALDPMPYIGVSTHTIGQRFSTQVTN